ncbi:hypothetical protein TNCV_3343911 [Trichonephila clavipes]|nr:hypothetical protein TNCV_3343911 [Trichonephila clavipes]
MKIRKYFGLNLTFLPERVVVGMGTIKSRWKYNRIQMRRRDWNWPPWSVVMMAGTPKRDIQLAMKHLHDFGGDIADRNDIRP